jgi:hypothetical protein
MTMPVGPPPEVLREVEVARKRAHELFASELELRFEVDHDQRRVWAALCLPDGSVVSRLSAQQALALGCGLPVGERLEG